MFIIFEMTISDATYTYRFKFYLKCFLAILLFTISIFIWNNDRIHDRDAYERKKRGMRTTKLIFTILPMYNSTYLSRKEWKGIHPYVISCPHHSVSVYTSTVCFFVQVSREKFKV
jgi:hypothetical protein